jgi:acetyl-CoA carboxylase biotin carboxyl carrier protein
VSDEPKRKTIAVIESPMVGFFYGSPSPDDPAFVSVGMSVSAGMTICIVEAMRVFTHIEASGTGTIIEVLAKNGDGIEYGQPLFRVETDNPEAFGIASFQDFLPEIRERIYRASGG